MFYDKKEDNDLRKDLGLSEERSLELMKILGSIETNMSQGGQGRTSHVLLGICSRRDLSDLEKIICSFMFACIHYDSSDIDDGNDIDASDIENLGNIKGDERCVGGMGCIGDTMNIGNMRCAVVAPSEIGKENVMAIAMSMLLEQLRQIPKSEMMYVCAKISKLFAKISETGEIKL